MAAPAELCFAEAQPFTFEDFNPIQPWIVDLNGDGVLDVAIAGQIPDTTAPTVGALLPLLGDGSGQLIAGTRLDGVDERFVLVDLDGDDIVDMIEPTADSSVIVRVGMGDGAFGPERAWPVGGPPFRIRSGDVDGDGVPDLITLNTVSDDVTVRMGDGTGSFGPMFTIVPDAIPLDAWVMDLDGDAVDDIVVSVGVPTNIRSYFGSRGAGPQLRGENANFGETYDLAGGDLDGDGLTDLVVAHRYDMFVSVYGATAAGVFSLRDQPASGVEPSSVQIADFDLDGLLDIVALNHGGNAGTGSVAILRNAGGGTLEPAVTLSLHPLATGLAVGDINGDGVPDIAAAGEGEVMSLLLSAP